MQYGNKLFITEIRDNDLICTWLFSSHSALGAGVCWWFFGCWLFGVGPLFLLSSQSKILELACVLRSGSATRGQGGVAVPTETWKAALEEAGTCCCHNAVPGPGQEHLAGMAARCGCQSDPHHLPLSTALPRAP